MKLELDNSDVLHLISALTYHCVAESTEALREHSSALQLIKQRLETRFLEESEKEEVKIDKPRFTAQVGAFCMLGSRNVIVTDGGFGFPGEAVSIDFVVVSGRDCSPDTRTPLSLRVLTANDGRRPRSCHSSPELYNDICGYELFDGGTRMVIKQLTSNEAPYKYVTYTVECDVNDEADYAWRGLDNVSVEKIKVSR